MSSLVVVTYPSLYQAEEVRLQLLKMQKEYLVDLEDAVIAVRKADGKVKLHQLYSLTAAGAVGGGFWGLLIGLIFLNPLLGVAVGAGAGAVSGALSDVGVNDEFMKNVARQLQPGHSLLFILFRGITLDKALEELRGTGGTVIRTSLSHEDEARLRAALRDGAPEKSASSAAEPGASPAGGEKSAAASGASSSVVAVEPGGEAHFENRTGGRDDIHLVDETATDPVTRAMNAARG